VLIENPSQYGLGPGLQTTAKNAQVYGIAVTHQYHCLQMIREAFYGLATRDQSYINDINIAANPRDFSTASLSPKADHIFHCFDYLRQTIICNADTTVEGQSLVEPKHIDGYGPLHQCRNWVSSLRLDGYVKGSFAYY
jgi:Mycotoxin biosynthesis protein UstYa